MKFVLRLFTFICYFLPFTFFLVTCNGGWFDVAYSQKEADTTLLHSAETTVEASPEKTEDSIHVNSDSLKNTLHAVVPTNNIYRDTLQNDIDKQIKSGNFWEKVLGKIIMPTNRSLSGIGSVFYFKNLTGQIVIAISLLISLILLAAYKFLELKKIKQYLLFTNVVCLIIFIVDAFISEVSLLWGVWILLGLLLIQSIKEFRKSDYLK